MVNSVKMYANAVYATNNWALVTLVAFVQSLLVRYVLTRTITKQVRRFDKEISKAVSRLYQRKSLWGWLFIGLGVVILVMAWFKMAFLLRIYMPQTWYIISFGLVFFGSYLHLRFYSQAVVELLKRRTEAEREY